MKTSSSTFPHERSDDVHVRRRFDAVWYHWSVAQHCNKSCYSLRIASERPVVAWDSLPHEVFFCRIMAQHFHGNRIMVRLLVEHVETLPSLRRPMHRIEVPTYANVVDSNMVIRSRYTKRSIPGGATSQSSMCSLYGGYWFLFPDPRASRNAQ